MKKDIFLIALLLLILLGCETYYECLSRVEPYIPEPPYIPGSSYRQVLGDEAEALYHKERIRILKTCEGKPLTL